MSIYIGNSQIGKIYIGDQRIGKVYVGSDLVYSDYTKCIENGRITDSSAFSNLIGVSTLDVDHYTSDCVIFGTAVDGEYTSDPDFYQNISTDGRIFLSPVYIGEKCTISYRSFYSARWADSVSAYIKNGNNTIGTEIVYYENRQTYTKTFTITDTELRLHSEYHGTSVGWDPSCWIGITQMEIGDP